jgi:hypothetical protein
MIVDPGGDTLSDDTPETSDHGLMIGRDEVNPAQQINHRQPPHSEQGPYS